jgi:hypothetical protein
VQQAEQVTDDHCVQQQSANTGCTKRFARLLLHLSVLQMGEEAVQNVAVGV